MVSGMTLHVKFKGFPIWYVLIHYFTCKNLWIDRSASLYQLHKLLIDEMNEARIAFGKCEIIVGEMIPPFITVLSQKFPEVLGENHANPSSVDYSLWVDGR
jgi:hypothetical protein